MTEVIQAEPGDAIISTGSGRVLLNTAGQLSLFRGGGGGGGGGKGEKGERGERGERGEKGERGERGEKGEGFTGAGLAQISGTHALIAEGTPGTLSKLPVSTVEWDNSGWWNASLLRYIPQKSGIYLISVAFQGTQGVNSGSFTDVVCAKNGAPVPSIYSRQQSVNSNYGPEGGAAGMVKMNGSTDYLEIWGGTPGPGFGGSSSITGEEWLGIAYLGS